MHFASLDYAILLTAVFVLYWAFGHKVLPRLGVLLVASYTFYAWWRVAYLGLIVASSFLDYVAGRRISESENPRGRKMWLGISLVGNLGMLGVFKYYNFLTISVSGALGYFGIVLEPRLLDLLLPVGISFYTFQSMSYTIDIYRGDLRPEDHALPFMVFVSFFPQLVAGPIVRARQFLPQLSASPSIDSRATTGAFALIALGLLKKSVIADLLAVNLVDRVFENPTLYTSMESLLGVYGYAAQIYCDFSAYSDIAIGSALLLGLSLPRNFDHPYRATSLQEFWRRWHISLSTWLRDYLYIPLGGSQGTSWKTYRNLAITMLLGGLWHGAAWTFVVWGALHGGGLALTRAFQRRFPGRRDTWLWRSLAIVFTFHFVCLSWVFFRAKDFHHAGELLAVIAGGTWGTANISPLIWGLLLAALATHVIPDSWMTALETQLRHLPAPLLGVLLVLVVLVIRAAATTDVVPFIYFQF